MTKWIHLELLDLSYNSLTTLSLETRLTLNKLDVNPKHRTKEQISLNLLGNPLKCTCENIPFLQWLARTELYLVDAAAYKCISDGGQLGNMSIGVSNILSRLESECSSKLWLILSSGGLALYCVVVSIITTWYRWRHYTKFLLYRMHMRRERLQALIGREGEYDLYNYDAFISCTREGAKWLKNIFCQNWKITTLDSNSALLKEILSLEKQLLITLWIPSVGAEKLFYLLMKLLSKVNGAKKSYYCLTT